IRTSIVENNDCKILDRNNQRSIDALDRGQKRARLVVGDDDDGQRSVARHHSDQSPVLARRAKPSKLSLSLKFTWRDIIVFIEGGRCPRCTRAERSFTGTAAAPKSRERVSVPRAIDRSA